MDLSNEENCKHVFDMLDKNHNGTLDIEEFAKAVRALGLNPSDSDIEEILKDFDANSDGVLNFQEFMQLAKVVKIGNENTPDDILRVYNKCYPDSDGFISTSELKKLLTGQGEPLKEHEVQQIISHFDKDGNGKIHVETLVKGLMG